MIEFVIICISKNNFICYFQANCELTLLAYYEGYPKSTSKFHFKILSSRDVVAIDTHACRVY